MGYLWRMPLFSAALFFFVGCSAMDRLIHPTAKPGPPGEPVIEQTQKEEPQLTPPPEPIVMVPAPPSLPPPPPPETPAVVRAPALRITEVVWASVNLREGPGMRYRVVGNVKKGTSVAILEDKGEWLHVQLEEGKGVWIFKLATAVSPKSPSPGDAPKSKPVSKPKPM